MWPFPNKVGNTNNTNGYQIEHFMNNLNLDIYRVATSQLE